MRVDMADKVEVLITLPFPNELVSRLRGVSNRLKITVANPRKPEEITPEVWARTEVLYTHHILPAPEQAPHLRWIQFHYAGIDSLVDAPILKNPDLVITTLSGTSASQLAEYAIMMCLALGHHLPDMIASQGRAEWPADRWERFSPLELRDSLVGIVGYGSIGRQIARLLRDFGATTLATKRDAMHPEDNGYIPEGQGDPTGDFVQRLYPSQALRSMLKDCDFVIIAMPVTPETRGSFGAAELAAMKPGAYLVNLARGEIIDQTALIEALRTQKIAGAALDVFVEEPLPPDSPLWKLHNVIITPHISGNSSHYDERAVGLFSENLQRYLAGHPLYNRFHPERGY
jgi:phosphoglycerate dehydrogenase-like enzyme